MKTKIAIVLGFALMVSANAASVNWTVNGNNTTVLNGLDGTPYTGSIYFILGDTASLASLETDSSTAFTTALAAITLNSAYSATDGIKPTVNTVAVSSPKLTAGTKYDFGLLVYDTALDGSISYKVITASQLAYADGAAAQDQKLVQTPWAKLASDTQAPWTAATPAVPEPSTAALALAGLALLLKRRKA